MPIDQTFTLLYFTDTHQEKDNISGPQNEDDFTSDSSDPEDESRAAPANSHLMGVARLPVESRPEQNEVSLYHLVSQLLEAVKELKQDIALFRSQLGIVNPLLSNSSTLQFHQDKISVFTGKLPCSSVSDLVLVNTILQDSEVAVSLVYTP